MAKLFENTNKTCSIIKDCDFCTEMTKIEKKLSEYVTRGYFETFDGNKMEYEFYKVARPMANLVISHGFTEFMEKYQEMVWYFVNMGYNVFLLSHRGHGDSYRIFDDYQLTHIDSFYDYVEDFTCFIDKIFLPNMDPDIPNYMFSHSMGGSIIALYLSKHHDIFSKAIFSAPMVCPITAGLPRILTKFFAMKEIRKSGPQSPFKYSTPFTATPPIDPDPCLSRERFVYYLDKRINNCKYQNSVPTNTWLYESVNLQPKVYKCAGKITANCLLLLAETDKVVRTKPQHAFFKRLPNAKMVTLKNTRHSVLTLRSDIFESYMNEVFAFLS